MMPESVPDRPSRNMHGRARNTDARSANLSFRGTGCREQLPTRKRAGLKRFPFRGSPLPDDTPFPAAGRGGGRFCGAVRHAYGEAALNPNTPGNAKLPGIFVKTR